MPSTLKIYSFTRCSTCRKAIAWLKKHNIEFELIDIINSPPTKEQIAIAVNQLGAVKHVLNTSGKSYRNIGASQIKSMSQSEVLELINSDSKLIKRPFVINNNGDVLVGFNELKWKNSIIN